MGGILYLPLSRSLPGEARQEEEAMGSQGSTSPWAAPSRVSPPQWKARILALVFTRLESPEIPHGSSK